MMPEPEPDNKVPDWSDEVASDDLLSEEAKKKIQQEQQAEEPGD